MYNEKLAGGIWGQNMWKGYMLIKLENKGLPSPAILIKHPQMYSLHTSFSLSTENYETITIWNFRHRGCSVPIYVVLDIHRHSSTSTATNWMTEANTSFGTKTETSICCTLKINYKPAQVCQLYTLISVSEFLIISSLNIQKCIK